MQNSRHKNLYFATPTSVDYDGRNQFHVMAIDQHSLNCLTQIQQNIKENGVSRGFRSIKEIFRLQSLDESCQDQISNQVITSEGNVFTLNSLCECINNCVNGRIPIEENLMKADNVYHSYRTDELDIFVKFVQKNCSHLTLSSLKYHNFHQYDDYRFTKLGFQRNKGYMIVDVRKDELAIHSFKNQSEWNSNLWECTTSSMQYIYYITDTDLGMLLRQVCHI